MKCIAMALLLSAACMAAQPSASEPHFYWSLSKSHELPYHHNLGNAKELSEGDRAALIRQVMQLVRPFMEDNEIANEAELRKLARNTRIELVDLNGDNKPEYILQAFDIKEGCGATGNCTFWIFVKTDHGFKKILDTRDKDGIGGDERITVESYSTNGFRDIVLAAHASAAEKSLELYRYELGMYRLKECYWADWVDHDHDERALKNPVIGACPKP